MDLDLLLWFFGSCDSCPFQPDWSTMHSSDSFSGITVYQGPRMSKVSSSTGPGPGPGSTDRQCSRTPSTALPLDTELARRGSNFGLPIALQLTALLGGSVGLVSVRDAAWYCVAPC